jgi:hypothetical protein
MQMNDWKIGTRITAEFAVVTAIAVVLGLYARNRVEGISANTDVVAYNRLPSMLEAGP